MGFSRPRYNAKARSHRSKPQDNEHTPHLEATEPQIVNSPDIPEPLVSISPEVSSNDVVKMSGKRKRRLEAYVDKKLKKERRTELIKSLVQTQQSIKNPSELISTAHLSSATVARTQREISAVTTEIESRRRARAREILKSKRKSQSGYHSQSEDEEDRASLTPNTDSGPVINSFSGAILIDTAPHLSPHLPTSVTMPPSASNHTTKPGLGSALNSNAITVIVKPRKKFTKLRRQAEISNTSDDSFDSSNSEYDDDKDDLSGSSDHSDELYNEDDANGPSDLITSLQDQEDGEESEEWGGCNEGGQDLCEADTIPESDMAAPSPSSFPASTLRVKGSIRDWAHEQLNRVADSVVQDQAPLDPQPHPTHDTTKAILTSDIRPKTEPGWGPLGTPLDLKETPLLLQQKTTHVDVSRPDHITASRPLLPVFQEEHTIMDAIRRHPVVVICGETGSGKTTQVPQFLYEAGWGSPDGDNPGMVGVTQPRRVAAVSMAHRVESEMGLVGRGTVGYQIRYDATTSSATRMKFMTDGVILRELAADFLLSKYSVVIVDEAHERSVNTDVLIGVLSRVVRLRMKMWSDSLSSNSPNKLLRTEGAQLGATKIYPLRLIIMSATLRVTDFTLNRTLFPDPPPVIEVAARQFPVAIHFNRKTSSDYIKEAFVKASKIHSRLPPGGILIFLTGQLEIMSLCRKLEQQFGLKATQQKKNRQEMAFNNRKLRPIPSGFNATPVQAENGNISEIETDTSFPESNEEITDADPTTGEAENMSLGNDAQGLAIDVDDGELEEEDPEALDTDEEEDLVVEGVELVEDSTVPMHILPLYSLLPTDQQMRVFEDPPSGSRLVIVATNVAETSLTIPNIRYVIDSGRVKERCYDLTTGIQSFEIDWVSKASAAQRAGRAGRTGPGHCYRLYSSAVFENYFSDFTKPEIQRMPIDGIVLQMKSMNIDTVTNFPFPTPPDRQALRKAELGLAHLGALAFKPGHDRWSSEKTRANEAGITSLGRAMARYPLTPRFSKMLVSGFQHGCLPYVIAIVSILSVGDPFVHEPAIDEDRPSDSLDENAMNEIRFVDKEDVRQKEIRKQKRRQYFQVRERYARLGGGSSDLFKSLAVVGAYEFSESRNLSQFCQENFVRPKSMEEIHKLRGQITRIVQATTAGSEIEVDFSPKLLPPSDLQIKVLRQLIASAFIDQVAVKASKLNSITSKLHPASQQQMIGYRTLGIQEEIFIHKSSILSDSTPDFVVFQELHRTGNKVLIKGITKINPSWLPTLGKSLCSFSKPIESSVKVISSDERSCIVIPKFGGPGLDLELSPIEVTQRKDGNRWIWV